MIVDSLANKEAIIVGSGPNGLAAAITLAQRGMRVTVLEARSTIGGGMRTGEITLPGYRHDICSAVHPLGMLSPFFKMMPLERYGLTWMHPTYALAHPSTDGTAVYLARSIEETVESFGPDGKAYKILVKPFVERAESLMDDILSPFRIPHHLSNMVDFGIKGVMPASCLVKIFKSPGVRAMYAGNAAHSLLGLDQILSSAVGLLLCMAAHVGGWPIARGGSQSIADAMAAYLCDLGGKIETGFSVSSLDDLPSDAIKVFDVSPRKLAEIVGDGFSSSYRRRLARYRYGPGVFKIDFALSERIPWQNTACKTAGTVHLGDTFEKIAAWEKGCRDGSLVGDPFVLVSQQSVFDSSRAPQGRHTCWAYCHVPNGWAEDVSAVIERQIERYAPGFKDIVIGRNIMNPVSYERYNPNYIGGDIIGGVQDLFQLYNRPVSALRPYATERDDVYICSASTPPGGGVHGMCGYNAANYIIRKFDRKKEVVRGVV